MIHRHAVILLGLVAIAGGCSGNSQEGSYPNRPISLVVPFGPGGGTDTFARVIKKAIEDNDLLPQPLVIINQGGAGATIGSRRVKNAKPDGYEILILHEAIVTAKYAGQANYGPEAFEPIAGTGKLGLVVAVADDSPYQSLNELCDAAVASPDTLVFAANIGAPTHFVGLMLEQAAAGARFRFTQTGGGAKRLHDLVGGHADVSVFSIEEYVRFQAAGLRAIAVCQPERHAAVPDVPTSHEQGFAVTHINMQLWWAPKNTPQSRCDVIAEALRKAMETPYAREWMARSHFQAAFVTGDSMRHEVDALRQQVSVVDLREPRDVPNLANVLLAAVVVLGGAVGVRGLRTDTRPLAESATPSSNFSRLAAIGGGVLTVMYVAILSGGWLNFQLATAGFVLAFGLILTRAAPRWWPAVVLVSVLMSSGSHFVFTRVFELVLP